VAYVLAGASEVGLLRVFRPSERQLAWVSDVVLSCAFGVAVYLWRHLSVTRQALAERERAELVLNTQLAVAADLQQRLLPTLPPAGEGVEWAALLQPAGKIGGDFYDLVTLAPGRWMLLVADVSGKGIPAAMALSTLRATFRALASEQLGPAAVLTQLSSALYEQWAGTPYLTGMIVRVDRRGGTIAYANAGHPPGVLAGPDGVRTLASLGPPAGMFPGLEYQEQILGIGAGDVCILVSDGITEALDDQQPSVVERIAGDAVGTRAPARSVCDAVMAEAVRGTGPAGVADWQDDRTVVVMAVREEAVPPTLAADRRGPTGDFR
jgi:sigma-B regulation protein RsbU (phosphoserine phosphatase)